MSVGNHRLVLLRHGETEWSRDRKHTSRGESVDQVSMRADRAVGYALDQMVDGDVVYVGHGHFSRAVVTRWVEQPLREGARYGFGTASVAVCGFEYGLRQLSVLGLTAHRDPITTP